MSRDKRNLILASILFILAVVLYAAAFINAPS